jgi:ADP-ribose pyrophosphatase YjhB (NUDIX family)
MNRGESLERGLAREVREETGYDVRVGRLLVVDASESGKVVFVFAAEIVGGKPDPAPLEIRALRWASADELTSMPEPDRSRLRVALRADDDGQVQYLAAPTIGR